MSDHGHYEYGEFKYDEYNCENCGNYFPIEELEHVPSVYRGLAIEKCPCCGHLGCICDVYEDPYSPGRMLVRRDELVKWDI